MEFSFKSNCIDDNELIYLNKLLLTNTPINTCLQMIKSRNNSKIIDSILNSLSSGKTIEESISNYLPKQLNSYIKPLLKHMSFSSALDLSLAFYVENKTSEKKISNSIAYPLALLFASLTGLYIFDLYGIDSIINLLDTFNSDLSSFISLRMMIKVVIYILYFAMLIISCLLLFFTREKRIVFLYIFLSKYLPNSLIQSYYSKQFVSLFIICDEKGYKTKETIEILNSMKNKPITSFLAYQLNETLLMGEELNKAIDCHYFDEVLARYIKIGIYSNDFINVLNSYIELVKLKIDKKMKEYTLLIQLITYLIIGMIIIFVYQVLFLPMQAIANY